MKKGKLIVNEIICQISFEENPSIYLEDIINEMNGTKSLTDHQNWNPFKINIVSKFGYDLLNEYDFVFIIPDKDSVVWKLKKCLFNNELNEIIFESCILYQD